jgi:hypothetical protein
MVLPILKNMSSSMGRMTSHIFMENKIHVWNHQSDIFIHTSGGILKIRDQLWPSNIGCLILDSAMFFADLGPKRAPFFGIREKMPKNETQKSNMKPKPSQHILSGFKSYSLVKEFFVKVKSRHIFWSHPYICLFVLINVQLLAWETHNLSCKTTQLFQQTHILCTLKPNLSKQT